MKGLKVYGPLAVFAALTVLKIAGVIALSWWWITAPLWISVLIAIVLVAAVFVVLRIYEVHDNR